MNENHPPGLENRASPPPALPADSERKPPALERLADKARDYARASSSANTQRAYASDWRHFESWCRRAVVEIAPDPQTIGLYLAACASTSSVQTIERRLSALTWQFAQRAPRSIAPIDTSPRCSPVSVGSTGGHPRKKKRSCPTTLSPCLPRCRCRPARPARPRHLARRLRRRPTPFGNHRPRCRPRSDRRQHWLDRVPRQGPAPHPARQVRLARGRDRARLLRPHLPCHEGGSGATIAIVDAFDDPTIAANLHLSGQYGLPACTVTSGCFTKVNQTGGTTLPNATPGWALEISLDVEWAHTLAPQAHILLVEANT